MHSSCMTLTAMPPHRTSGWRHLGRYAACFGEASEIVFTSLPGPPEVEAVALGENGLLPGIRQAKFISI